MHTTENPLVPCKSYIIHELACSSTDGASDCGEIHAAALCILACVSDFYRETFQGGYKQRLQAECLTSVSQGLKDYSRLIATKRVFACWSELI